MTLILTTGKQGQGMTVMATANVMSANVDFPVPALEQPKQQVAKKPQEWACPYGKEIDCQHIKVGGICNRRSYANRKPDKPCTSYLRKPKVKL